MSKIETAHEMGMHTETLRGRTQQAFFEPEEEENFLYPGAFEVDPNQRAEIDGEGLESTPINLEIRKLLSEGFGTIVVKNPGAKHSLGVGILNRLNLHFEGSLGYFGCGLARSVSGALRMWSLRALTSLGSRRRDSIPSVAGDQPTYL